MHLNNIQDLLRDSFSKFGECIAIETSYSKISYKELDKLSNHIAHYLINRNVEDYTRIGIYGKKVDIIVSAIVGILKANCTFIPLSKSNPPDRLDRMVKLANIQHILFDEEDTFTSRLEDTFKTSYSCILNNKLSDLNNSKKYQPHSCSHIYFTSGSTGEPKAILGKNIGLVHFMDWFIKTFNVQDKERFSVFSDIGFSVFKREIFIPLLTGSTIVVPDPQTLQDMHQLALWVDKSQVTFMNCVPSLFKIFSDFAVNKEIELKKLKFIFLAGEKIYPKHIEIWQKRFSQQIQLVNLYGPTETTQAKFCYLIKPKDIHIDDIPVGYPISNTDFYILDDDLSEQPTGQLGNIAIATHYMSFGYYNKALNENTFTLYKGRKVYLTGDIGTLDEEGLLHLHGRKDHQVKINGVRIELHEITQSLLKHHYIKDCITLCKKDRNHDNAIFSFIILADPTLEISQQELRKFLLQKLPASFIPQYFFFLDKFPKTINGKIDFNSLKKINPESNLPHISYRTELEQQLCQIWAEALALNEKNISINEDFFRLGGNSILAIKIVSNINKVLRRNISISALFKHPTIEKLGSYLNNYSEDSVSISEISILEERNQVLSFAQERLWFIENYEGGTNAYIIPIVFKIPPECRLDILEKSLNSIVVRHEILRTLIKEDEEGNRYQAILDDKLHPLNVFKIKVSDLTALHSALKEQINCIYDLSNEHPIRVCVYELANTSGDVDYYISIAIHHIAFDGWSTDIFLRELHAFYNYYLDQSQGLETPLNLPDLSIQYKDFAIWQRNYLTGERLNKQLSYWKQKLSGHEPLNLNKDKARLSQINYAGNDIYFELDEQTSFGLRELAKQCEVSLYSLLLSAYYLMLRSYSNQDDIVIGTPLANRHYNQIENLIGFFVNSLALRTQIDSKELVTQFIQKVGQEVIDAQLHQDLPFEKLVEELKVEKDTSKHPIFQVMFGVQSFGSSPHGEAGLSTILQPYTQQDDLYKIAKFDISTFMDDSQTCIKGVFNYALSLYEETTIQRFIETYAHVLSQLAQLGYKQQRQEETTIADLTYLPDAQHQQIIHTWNNTDKEYPDAKTIHALFEEQVERTPNNIALVYEETQLTYKELNEKANQLAHYIRKHYEIKPDTLIALCLDRSEHMLIAILAVLKAGGAYVPMDPSYPNERMKYILEDTQAAVILTNQAYQQQLESISSKAILAIDNKILLTELLLQQSTNPQTETTSTNLAYVIYTSGTTGNPKGVMIEHRGIVNRITWMNDTYPLNPGDKILQKTPYVFDVSVWELFWAHWYGACVVFAEPEKHKDAHYIAELIQKESITIAHFVPSMLSVFMEILRSSGKPLGLRYIFCSGEALSLTQVQQCHAILPSTQIHNLYGPTEASVDVLYYDCTDKDIKSINIGKPISNTKAYILGHGLTPLPIGAIGELYIGSVGLARGYLNKPDLTQERFVLNPFQTAQEKAQGKNGVLYKTGDLARWLSDGNIEYLGRNDFQVKIRGYRIELGEIEAILSTYEGVQQSVIIAKEQNGNKYLVGYYVADYPLEEETIFQYLQAKLPDYMVPSALVFLEELPLTINGKLDRKALPAPELTSKKAYIKPRNELEEKVCQIWSEVLGLPADKVGIQDDFFRLGGDSIVSIQLVSRLRQRLGLTVSIKDIFAYKTIGKLYENVFSKDLANASNIQLKTEQGLLSGQVPLLPIQEWFFENNFAKQNHWNQSFIVKVPELDLDRLQASIIKLVQHHDALRLRYKKDQDEWTQYYAPEAEVAQLKTLDIRTIDSPSKLSKILTDWQSEFNLEYGPTYVICYLYGYEDKSARLYFALHHLITDAVSWRILTEDIKDLYEGKELGDKGTSYRQWGHALKDYAQEHETEKTYWSEVLADYDQGSIEHLMNYPGTLYGSCFSLSPAQTKQLLRESNKAYHTQINDILLTALALALPKITGTLINHIVLEGHGREEIDSCIDTTRTAGWFTTMYPVRLEMKDHLGKSIQDNKEMLREVPNKGIGYGPLIGYHSDDLPKIVFNYLGQFDKEDTLGRDWRIANEDSGQSVHPDNQDHWLISINGMVINNQLTFNISSKLDRELTSKFVASLTKGLEDIIHHTTQQDRSYLTASDVGNVINQDYLDKLQESREVESVYLANSLQQGFVYHALSQGHVDDAYCVQVIWQYGTAIEIDKLKEAWMYAQKKFGTLRLRFAWEEEIVQIIDKKGQLDWRYIDLSQITDLQAQEERIKEIQEKDRSKPYQLDQGSLFRVYLIKQDDNLYTCIFSNHHAILDGWSIPLLQTYIHDTYLSLCANKAITLNIDYSYEQTQKYLQENASENKEFWSKYLARIEEKGALNQLALDNKDANISNLRIITDPQEQSLIIENTLYDHIKDLSRNSGVTFNAILQYVWHKVLSAYNRNCHTMIGTTVSGRSLLIDNIESSLGLYINTLPLAVDHKPQPTKTVLGIIKDIQNNINEINSRSNVSLAKLQKGQDRLFDSLFVYENYPSSTKEQQRDKLKIRFKGSKEKIDYPLAVLVYESGNQLIFTIKYAGELFSKDTIDRLLSMVNTLLEQIVINPNQLVENLRYLDDKQYQQIIHTWNNTDKEYPDTKTIQSLFEEQVERTPNNIALVYEGTQLTYKELNEKANQLAHYIREHYEIKPDTLMALCLDRSEHMLITILAVLKAGGAYVPMDPSYPDERMKYILEDTQAEVVLADEVHKQRLEDIIKDANTTALSKVVNILAINEKGLQEQLSVQPSINPRTETTSTDLAYVIYTSGTTGNPKGVMIEHKSILNLLFQSNLENEFKSNKQGTLWTNINFDVSVYEIFTLLLNGGALHILSSPVRGDAYQLFNYIEKHKINYAYIPPYFLTEFPENKIFSLEFLLLGVEKIKFSNLKNILSSNKSIKILNGYGPTEATVFCTDYLYNSNDDYLENLPIGTPISNTSCYILDETLNPLPRGAIGELYIGGAGLARGYLNRPDLTYEKFIANPFQTGPQKKLNENSILYKTGDLVRWLPDGNIEYIGRNDFQVKIRGYRIELGEIEAAISSYEGIQQSVVIAKELNKNKYLVGYYVADYPLEEEIILQYLQAKLPDYMVPSALVFLKKLPLTLNGKLDRKALPDPELTNKETYVKPRNDLEQQICQIWSDVLGLPENEVGVHDNFFKLGGNSILAMRLVSKMNKELSCNLVISSIFKHNKVGSLAEQLRLDIPSHIISYNEEWSF